MKKVGELYAYEIVPMDGGWESLPTIEEFSKTLVESDAPAWDWYENPGKEVTKFFDFVKTALEAGKEVDWEGDFREEPHVAAIPCGYSPKWALVWKQDNNGDTFVVSQVPLPHLEEYE